jgi:hypothetical protein
LKLSHSFGEVFFLNPIKLTNVCAFDGKTYAMDIPALTPERLEKGLRARENGALIQNAFPYLNADEREFILTGTLPHVWDEMFGDDD